MAETDEVFMSSGDPFGDKKVCEFVSTTGGGIEWVTPYLLLTNVSTARPPTDRWRHRSFLQILALGYK